MAAVTEKIVVLSDQFGHPPAKKGRAIPTDSDILKAFREEPPEEGATSDELTHMNFFLNVAMPAVDPTVLKATAWSNNGSNHVDFFQSTYPHEITTALLLVSHFSDLSNVLHNAGLIDDQGNRRDGSPIKPQKKKRKKMQTKAGETQLCAVYCTQAKAIQAMLREPDFKERMIRWDKRCCSHRNKVQDNGPAQRANTVPHRFRHLEECSVARDFIMSAGLTFWPTSGSSAESEGTSSPFQIVTQPEAPSILPV